MAQPMLSKKTFLITGASSGIGRAIAAAALIAGHCVVGTSRDIAAAASANPAFEAGGGTWLQLDISSPSTTEVVANAMAAEEQRQSATDQDPGSVEWVVVNNAGSALQGIAEDCSEAQIEAYLQAMVHGVIRVLKAAVPVLRRNGKGTLLTISSNLGFCPLPEVMLYCAAKAAVDALMEGYAGLLAPWGIRVVSVVPGGTATDSMRNSDLADGGVSADYEERLSKWEGFRQMIIRGEITPGGDPVKTGERVVEVVDGARYGVKYAGEEWKGKHVVVLLGKDGYGAFKKRLEALTTVYEASADIAMSTCRSQ